LGFFAKKIVTILKLLYLLHRKISLDVITTLSIETNCYLLAAEHNIKYLNPLLNLLILWDCNLKMVLLPNHGFRDMKAPNFLSSRLLA
jgi:hypothetical protein